MPIQMPNKNPKKPTNWRKVSKQLSFWVFVILVPVAIIQFSGKGADATPEISYSQYDQQLQKNNVDKVTIQAGRLLTGEFKEKVPVKGRLVSEFRCAPPTRDLERGIRATQGSRSADTGRGRTSVLHDDPDQPLPLP